MDEAYDDVTAKTHGYRLQHSEVQTPVERRCPSANYSAEEINQATQSLAKIKQIDHHWNNDSESEDTVFQMKDIWMQLVPALFLQKNKSHGAPPNLL